MKILTIFLSTFILIKPAFSLQCSNIDKFCILNKDEENMVIYNGERKLVCNTDPVFGRNIEGCYKNADFCILEAYMMSAVRYKGSTYLCDKVKILEE